jgi:S-adenosylmethionine:tRNA ribosyltransferase-isomerase
MVTSLSINDFNYNLPDSSVAKYPLPERDQSKLLVWKNGEISDHFFFNLPELLPKASMLVFNNTRVIHARLHFTKPTGAKIEIFCLEPTLPNDYVLSFAQTTSCRWKCMVGNLKRWKGEVLRMEVAMGKEDRGGDWETGGLGDRETERLGDLETGRLGEVLVPERSRRVDGDIYRSLSEAEGGKEGLRDERTIVVLKAEMGGELEGGLEINFSWDNPIFTFSEILEAAGTMPIPPYLHRESEEVDLTVYQTVYSKIRGSVAAPTAGLHFTERVLKELASRDIACEELTLHVGAGTFQPVKSETTGDHRMHTEHFYVSQEMIDRMIAHQEKVIAVGTTSVRTLESLYWIGRKIALNPQIAPDQLWVTQWEPYQDEVPNIGAKMALSAISTWLTSRNLTALDTATQIMILPGYKFRIIDGLMTNFHQPKSTLLLLISAILGLEWKRIYTHALANEYRFLSYGDANLYWV